MPSYAILTSMVMPLKKKKALKVEAEWAAIKSMC